MPDNSKNAESAVGGSATLMIRLNDVTGLSLNPEYVKTACHDNLSHI